MLGLPVQAAGAIIAALIAGLISLLGLIISKEQKVSDFRQAWIDELRIDIAAVIANAHAIHGAFLTNQTSANELWKNVREEFVAINGAWARIKLRLNPKEEQSIAVLEVLNQYEALFNTGTVPNFESFEGLDKKLLNNAQVLLKEEWRRVRSGELAYRVAKRSAILVIAVCICALVWHFVIC